MSGEEPKMHMKRAETEAVLAKAVKKFTEFSDLSLPGHKIHKTDKSAGVVIRTGETHDDAPVPYFICTGTLNNFCAKDVIERLMVKSERRHEWCPAWDTSDTVEEWEAETDELKALLGENKLVRVYLERTKPVLGGLISARCFVFGSVTWEKDGKHNIIITSVDKMLEGEIPSGYVGLPHGTMFVSGTVAKDKEDGKGSEVSSLVQTIAGGSIPNWATTKGISSELTSFFTLVNKVYADEKK